MGRTKGAKDNKSSSSSSSSASEKPCTDWSLCEANAIWFLKKYRPTNLTPLLEGEFVDPRLVDENDVHKKKVPLSKKETEELERRKRFVLM